MPCALCPATACPLAGQAGELDSRADSARAVVSPCRNGNRVPETAVLRGRLHRRGRPEESRAWRRCGRRAGGPDHQPALRGGGRGPGADPAGPASSSCAWPASTRPGRRPPPTRWRCAARRATPSTPACWARRVSRLESARRSRWRWKSWTRTTSPCPPGPPGYWGSSEALRERPGETFTRTLRLAERDFNYTPVRDAGGAGGLFPVPPPAGARPLRPRRGGGRPVRRRHPAGASRA